MCQVLGQFGRKLTGLVAPLYLSLGYTAKAAHPAHLSTPDFKNMS